MCKQNFTFIAPSLLILCEQVKGAWKNAPKKTVLRRLALEIKDKIEAQSMGSQFILLS